MREILVIDDDDAVRATIIAHLARIDARISDFSDARDALKLMASRKFDLVICDLFMPELDGLKFIAEARRIHPSLPVILISGGGQMFPVGGKGFGNLAKTAGYLGASQVLEKPFRGRQMREMVNSLLPPVPPGEPCLSAS